MKTWDFNTPLQPCLLPQSGRRAEPSWVVSPPLD